jgi:hypothetical protein
MITTDIAQTIFQGNGASTQFQIPFDVDKDSAVDLFLVTKNGEDEMETVINYGFEFIKRDNAYYIIYPVAGTNLLPLSTIQKLKVVRDTAKTQQLTSAQKAFSSSEVEAGLDKVTLILQELDQRTTNIEGILHPTAGYSLFLTQNYNFDTIPGDEVFYRLSTFLPANLVFTLLDNFGNVIPESDITAITLSDFTAAASENASMVFNSYDAATGTITWEVMSAQSGTYHVADASAKVTLAFHIGADQFVAERYINITSYYGEPIPGTPGANGSNAFFGSPYDTLTQLQTAIPTGIQGELHVIGNNSVYGWSTQAQAWIYVSGWNGSAVAGEIIDLVNNMIANTPNGQEILDIVPSSGTYLPPTRIWADGTTYTNFNQLFPEAYQRIINNTNYKTMAQYQTELNGGGECGFYGVNGTTVRVPLINRNISGVENLNQTGQYVIDRMRPITGSWRAADQSDNNITPTATGAFGNVRSGHRDAENGSSDGWAFDFDSGRLGPNFSGTETRGKAILYPYQIVVKNRPGATSLLAQTQLITKTTPYNVFVLQTQVSGVKDIIVVIDGQTIGWSHLSLGGDRVTVTIDETVQIPSTGTSEIQILFVSSNVVVNNNTLVSSKSPNYSNTIRVLANAYCSSNFSYTAPAAGIISYGGYDPYIGALLFTINGVTVGGFGWDINGNTKWGGGQFAVAQGDVVGASGTGIEHMDIWFVPYQS